MPCVKDAEFHPEERRRFLEVARVQLMVCGPKIFQNATIKDLRIEVWLSVMKMGVAG